MKEKRKAPMEFVGKGFIYRTSSTSRVGVSHLTIFDPDSGIIRCECEGFRNHNKCWHTTELTTKHLGDPNDEGDLDDVFVNL